MSDDFLFTVMKCGVEVLPLPLSNTTVIVYAPGLVGNVIFSVVTNL